MGTRSGGSERARGRVLLAVTARHCLLLALLLLKELGLRCQDQRKETQPSATFTKSAF